MLIARNFNSREELLNILRGTPIASGAAGTNTGASANFQDLTTGAFADVLVGDTIHISGESSPFTVDTKTDDNNLILDTTITNAHTADGMWRVFRGGIAIADIQVGPVPDPLKPNSGLIIYDEPDFVVR